MKVTYFVVAFLILLTAPQVQAQSKISVAGDVTPYFFKGNSIIAFAEFDFAPHILFGLERFEMEMPTRAIESNLKNKDKGWGQSLRGVIFYCDYFAKQEKIGSHFGVALNKMQSRITREGASEVKEFELTEALLRYGFRWDLGNQLFLDPWVMAGLLSPSTADRELGGERFDVPQVQVLGTLHLGYRF